MNTITIYQNGLASFERIYKIKGKQTLSIPFKTTVIGDVAATLSVLGENIKMSSPSYQPKRKSPALTLSPTNLTNDLFTKLSGAHVKLIAAGHNKESYSGRVIGCETENNLLEEQIKVITRWLTILSEDGYIHRLNLEAVENYTFTDPEIQSEIKKALDWNVQQINPESIYLNLDLTTDRESDIVVKYIIPNPAFKLTYKLKQSKSGWTLLGNAVVDNDTDEDWKDCLIRCATGQPVTFETDIADLATPRRQKVNLVNQEAVEVVEVASDRRNVRLDFAGAAPESDIATFKRVSIPLTRKSSKEVTQAECTNEEIGDSTIFQCSEPTTIPSRRSAIIKILEQKLKNSKECLYYNCTANRIMRAVRFTNEGDYALSRGVVAVEQYDNFMGNAILSNCKPGESAMLCHAAETGVKTLRDVKEKTNWKKHSLDKGMLVTDYSRITTNSYIFNNVRNEEFTLYIDYQKVYNGEVVARNGSTKLSGEDVDSFTTRYKVTVPANESVSVVITEETTTHSSFRVDEFLEWMQRNPESPLLRQAEMHKVVATYRELSSLNMRMEINKKNKSKLNEEQERLRKNIQAVTGSDSNAMKSRLVASENEINKLEAEAIDLTRIHSELSQKVRDMITACTISVTA